MSDQATIEDARNNYGITNADEMSDEQLKSEMKAIDDQAKPAKASRTTTQADEESKDTNKEPSRTRRRTVRNPLGR